MAFSSNVTGNVWLSLKRVPYLKMQASAVVYRLRVLKCFQLFFLNTVFGRMNKFYRLLSQGLTLWMLSSSTF